MYHNFPTIIFNSFNVVVDSAIAEMPSIIVYRFTTELMDKKLYNLVT